MMNLAQWQSRRRVDHLNLGFAHPRVRGQPDANIKAFDAHVQAYHQANNLFDRIAALGEIIRQGAAYIVGGPRAALQNAVQALVTDARQTLVQTLQGSPIDGMGTVNTLIYYNAAAFAQKTIRVNVFLARTPADVASDGLLFDVADADNLINDHIQRANQILQAARIQVARNPARANTEVVDQHNAQPVLAPALAYVPAHDHGSFSDPGRVVLTNYFNANIHNQADRQVDVVYVPRFQQALQAQGVTTRHNDVARNPRPRCPFVVISEVAVQQATYPTTLAHELLHAVFGSGDHSSDANNLMADGNIRNGVNQLSVGQIAALRNCFFAA